MKQNLFLDLDSTVTDSVKAYCDIYAQYFGNHPDYVKPNPLNVQKWDLSDECFLAKDICEAVFGTKEFFNYLNFFPEADRVIQKLTEKYNVCIVSIGTFSNIQYKSEWIKKNMPYIHDAVLLAREKAVMNKSLVNMGQEDIFIDDVLSNLTSTNAGAKYIFGIEKPWNIEYDGYKRLRNWLEVEKELL